MKTIQSIEELEQNYGATIPGALWKEIDHINDHYRQFIEKSPFLILATIGNQGRGGEHSIDCSPRGDPAGFVRVVNSTCIQIPDRRGNNRLDSLRNIVDNPEVGLIFLIPGVGETLRVSGKASIVIDQALCESFAIKGKSASSVISIDVEKVYFQCQKALVRSKLWDETEHLSRDQLSSAGEMVKVFTDAHNVEFDAQEYDKNYPDHMKKTIY